MTYEPGAALRKFKSITVVMQILLAVLAAMVTIISMNVIDRSSEHVTGIERKRIVEPPAEKLADAMRHKNKADNFHIRDADSAHPSCYIAETNLGQLELNRIIAVRKVRELTLNRCQFTDQFLNGIHEIPIEGIHILNAKIQPKAINSLAQSAGLRRAEFRNCTFFDHSLTSFSQTSITNLQLIDCENGLAKPDFTESDLQAIAQMPHLKILELSRSRLGQNIGRALSKSRVVLLNCSHCRLSDDDMGFLAKMPALTYVSVKDNPVTCKGISLLAHQAKIMQICTDIPQVQKCNFTTDELLKISSHDLTPPKKLQPNTLDR